MRVAKIITATRVYNLSVLGKDRGAGVYVPGDICDMNRVLKTLHPDDFVSLSTFPNLDNTWNVIFVYKAEEGGEKNE